MKTSIVPARAALLAIVSLSAIGPSVSTATAMPAVGGLGTRDAAGLLRTAEDQHRVYPGSDSAEAKRRRAARMAPNKFCQKHDDACD